MSEKENSTNNQIVCKTQNDSILKPKIGAAINELNAGSNLADTQLGKALLQWLEKNPGAVEQFAQKIHSTVATFVEIAIKASTFIGQMAMEAHEAYAARIEHYPHFLAMIPLLAQRGWFVSESLVLSQIDELAVRARDSKIEQIENLLFTLYDENIVWLGEELVRNFPSKTFLIQPAIAAHQRGEYAASIPLFFILTDGVCLETVNRNLFQGRGEEEKFSVLARSKVEATKSDDAGNVILEFYNAMSNAMWKVQSEKLPLAYSQKERDTYNYIGLNRHTIMHGIAGDEYATKENSLKAFSLLSHIAALTERQVEVSR